MLRELYSELLFFKSAFVPNGTLLQKVIFVSNSNCTQCLSNCLGSLMAHHLLLLHVGKQKKQPSFQNTFVSSF